MMDCDVGIKIVVIVKCHWFKICYNLKTIPTKYH